MNVEEFRAYCKTFKGATEDFPFEDDNIIAYKVMEKIFALADIENFKRVNVKCDPVKAVTLRELYPEVEPGFHMNKRLWNAVEPEGGLDDLLIKEWISDSYDLVVENLPRKEQKKLEKMEEE